ncbi:hypothetical protein PIB30_028818 [Stylosanthes scabra]|uniref:Uncharacterized protein n=1 Tax=Stylosanthes scabra TaxID=79078 RepID=A0ABU6TAT6_9FABA|nr:hypothetical protein [Stylosanthes scabra]
MGVLEYLAAHISSHKLLYTSELLQKDVDRDSVVKYIGERASNVTVDSMRASFKRKNADMEVSTTKVEKDNGGLRLTIEE